MRTTHARKQEWLGEFLALPNGIPNPDTFRRVEERLNPQVFERCFQRWVQSLVDTLDLQVIAQGWQNTHWFRLTESQVVKPCMW